MAFALTFFCRFSTDIYGVYMDPSSFHLHIYNSVQYIYDAYMAFTLPSSSYIRFNTIYIQYNLYLAYIWIRSYSILIYDSVQHIYKPHLSAIPIHTILYNLYLIHIWHIYEPGLGNVLIYMIQYNLYLIHIWKKSASPRLKTDWFSFT